MFFSVSQSKSLHLRIRMLVLLLIGATIAATPNPDMVAIVFRHGQRAPEGTFPKDPHTHVYWPNGYGSLTKIGAEQIYKLSQKIHTRYRFLNYADNVFVRSSAVNRAIDSGMAFIKGFQDVYNLSESIEFSVVPDGKDNFINFMWICPKYQEELERLTKNPPAYVKHFLAAHPGIIDKIVDVTGFETENILVVWWLYNIFKVQAECGLKLTNEINELRKDLKTFPAAGFRLLAESDFMKKVKGGVLLADIIKQFEQTVQGVSKKNFIIFSGHDLTIFHLMSVLGIKLEVLPNYGAAVVVEFYREPQEVKILYMDHVDSELQEQIIPLCPKQCTLQSIRKNFANFLIWNDEQFKQACDI